MAVNVMSEVDNSVAAVGDLYVGNVESDVYAWKTFTSASVQAEFEESDIKKVFRIWQEKMKLPFGS